MVTLALIILIASLTFSGAVDDAYLDCMCEVETNCQTLNNCDSNGCGYFQLTQSYYVACDQPWRNVGERFDHAWKHCANNLKCSKKCVNNYLRRRVSMCQSDTTDRVYAKVHKGGPDGCTSFKASEFANKVNDCLVKKKKLVV